MDGGLVTDDRNGEAEVERVPRARYEGPCFTVKRPLVVGPREAFIIDRRLLVLGKVSNAVISLTVKRYERMRQDPGFRRAAGMKPGRERSQAFRELRARYRVPWSENECANLAFGVWQDSKWMGTIIESAVVLARGRELWGPLSRWMFEDAGRPRPRPARELDTAMNFTGKEGLRATPDVLGLRWDQPASRPRQGSRTQGRKHLLLAIRWKDAVDRERSLNGGTVHCAGITREVVGHKVRYFALLRVRGVPYRDPERLWQVGRGAHVGIDPGVSRLAVVSETHSAIIPLADPNQAVARELAAERRRLQRALDRSRRAMNPDCYDEQGRAIKGRRPRRKSKRGQRLELRLRGHYRRERERAREHARHIARQVEVLGDRVTIEKCSLTGWRGQYSKRLATTRPGAALGQIKTNTLTLGGRHQEIQAQQHAFSQHCLCGKKVKKLISERQHTCQACGLGPLDRDLFSALLIRLAGQALAQGQIIDISTGELNTPENRRAALALCATPTLKLAVPQGTEGRAWSLQPAQRQLAVRPPREDSNASEPEHNTGTPETPNGASGKPARARQATPDKTPTRFCRHLLERRDRRRQRLRRVKPTVRKARRRSVSAFAVAAVVVLLVAAAMGARPVTAAPSWLDGLRVIVRVTVWATIAIVAADLWLTDSIRHWDRQAQSPLRDSTTVTCADFCRGLARPRPAAILFGLTLAAWMLSLSG